MDDRQMKRRVGIAAIGSLVAAALLVAYTSRMQVPFFQSQYPVNIQVARAPGVGPNTPVRRDGVLIGRVDKIESIRGGVMITAKIDEGQELLASDSCRIRPSSLFGDAIIDFAQAGDINLPPQPVVAGATVQGVALPDPIETITKLQVDVGPAVQSLGEAATSVTELADKMNRVLGDDANGEKVVELFDKAIVAFDDFSTTMDQMSAAAASIQTIVGDPNTQIQIKQTIAQAPKLLSDIREVAQGAMTAVDSLDGAIVSAERNLKNIEGITEPLSTEGPALVKHISISLENLETILTNADRFVTALNESQGTIGMLVKDPSLYNNVNTVVCNFNTILHKVDTLANEVNKIAKSLEPVINDARVFADKIAREPGRLVGGALNRGPGLK